MKKTYVPKTLNEFLSESKSIPLKRKYGERPAVIAGANAPLRNQVLSFVAESGSVSKRELKQFILGLKEGGSTVAAANMFIKRNSQYFITENKGDVTYFRLSNILYCISIFLAWQNQFVAFRKIFYQSIILVECLTTDSSLHLREFIKYNHKHAD
jgi:hypothetical protein